jgi:hypothetical protein
MNQLKIKQIKERINKNRERLSKEKDGKKKEILRLKIGIDEYKLRIENLK